MRYDIDVLGRIRRVEVTRGEGHYTVAVDGRTWTVDAVRIDGQILSLLMADGSRAEVATAGLGAGGRSEEIVLASAPGGAVAVRVAGVPLEVHPNGRRASRSADAAQTGPQRLTAPMPGKVVRVLVKAGDTVVARQPVVVVEAMKMENELRAARDGRVSDIAVRDGELVEAGALLAVIADS